MVKYKIISKSQHWEMMEEKERDELKTKTFHEHQISFFQAFIQDAG